MDFSWFKKLGIGGESTEDTAVLEVKSETQGSLPAPKMTEAQRDAISSPADGLKIYNLDEHQYEYWDDSQSEWRPIGSGSVAYNEKIGNGDGVTDIFNLSFIPSTGESIMLFANVPLIYGTDFTLLGTQQVQLTVAPEIDVEVIAFYLTEGQATFTPTPANVHVVENIDVTAGQAFSKLLNLANTPAVPQNVRVDVIGGGPQRYGVDYVVSGSVLSWNGLRMEDGVEENTELVIEYFT